MAGPIEAIQAKFAALSFSGKPSMLWFGEADLKDIAGNSTTLPVVEMYHEGAPFNTTLEYDGMIDWTLRFDVYANSYQECENVCYGILYNGSAPESAAGFAYGTITLTTPWEFLSFEMLGEAPVFQRLNASRTATGVPAYLGQWRQVLKTVRYA